jgi:short-subunit dehydrogenase
MTAGMKLPGPLTVEPDVVASAIYRAAEEKPRDVIYVGPIWQLVMMVIRAMPEKIFKRLRL